ncbi:NAD(P)H-dependent glycerol-3-phosphate dehydrogenase [Alkaliphilus hydrothermalis]|uniref:Glycerol-3-phosphate dehydrogenase [NAD(P)+] n=1 Tax=Alkaliphilus hydrothermalis TaxID=1482730 RepID=A0ABS2NNP5_9FIRM|nr:NAD(P)H-dependent glycerol-3-phosphate dehydrogenase [Alkaliphilus hydrothermalis]MBM7614563.1 glycerol-3-phosphate dehydrogenase (NAD(P)+) [Alkaliphilus hydrothermalis]
MNYSSIAVLGAGSWGTALALVLQGKGHRVNLWMRDIKQYEEMLEKRENCRYLPNVHIPEELYLSTDLEKAILDVDVILMSVPTQSVRSVFMKIAPIVKPHQIIVNTSKGLEQNTLLRISEVIDEILPGQPFVTLSGPSHAEEVCKEMPTTVAVASKSRSHAEYIQDLFITPSFRVYTNPDLVGVELGGALKNVIAFGAGITDGLGFGDNAKAALMTRGIREIARLGKAMGGNLATFAGLSGIGDLIVTCTSMHSRNRRAGILVGQGKTLEETLKEIGMVVEGITTTKAAFQLAKEYNIEMPITEEIYNILYEGTNAKDAVTNLMTRNRTHEMEEVVETENLNW